MTGGRKEMWWMRGGGGIVAYEADIHVLIVENNYNVTIWVVQPSPAQNHRLQ